MANRLPQNRPQSDFSSRIIADVGISMGDEGKGRVVCEVVRDLLSQGKTVNMSLKVNGGANAGHTAAGLRLNLLPVGVALPEIKHIALGSGVVADPRKLNWEVAPLEENKCNVLARLGIDERTMFSDVTHRLLDLAWENYRSSHLGQEPRGSTGRGISPAYADEVNQCAIPYSIFRGSKDVFADKIKERAQRTLRMIQHVLRVTREDWFSFFDLLTETELRANKESLEKQIFKQSEFDFLNFKGRDPYTLNMDYLIDTYWSAGTHFKEALCDIRELALQSLAADEYMIAEFGQSYWLDKRHGFSPNVTASHTFTPELFESLGIPLQPVHTIGCCKAYDTKVGTHVFLTEMGANHPLSHLLKKMEFGVSTGRQRQVGWFDAVEKGDALRYGGFQDLVINKLDALAYRGDWQEGGELLVCVAYRDENGKIYKHVPREDSLRKQLFPAYRQFPGWSEDISNVRSFYDLPENARNYVIGLYESIIDIAYDGKEPPKYPNIRYLGVGPNPDQVIKDVPQGKDLLCYTETSLNEL